MPPSRLRRRGVRLPITLALLAILVVVGSVVGPRLLSGMADVHSADFSGGNNGPARDSGPFVQTPLNPQQVDELRHLAQRMKYKQLASLYVARMTQDEELGQLIMVEYDDQYYSDDLNTMINQLHAGGVIMYEFQMLTLNQTKHDIAQMQQHAALPLLISTDE